MTKIDRMGGSIACSEHERGIGAGFFEDKPFVFCDGLYLEARRQTVKCRNDHAFLAFPLNIYELHPPTFKKEHPNNGDGMGLVRTADELCTYVKQLGHTHVKPIFTDGEESRLTSYEVKYFVNRMHENGIGVIWSLDTERMLFGVTDESELAAGVLRLASDYHIDGVSVGGSGAKRLVPVITQVLKDEFPDILVFTEDDRAHTTGKDADLAINEGWADGILPYFSEDPYFRKHHHKKLISGAEAGIAEPIILSLSHKTVSEGKGSLLSRNFGDYNMKFAGFRTLLAYHMTCPGKKLMFMGSEYAPFRAWSNDEELEWFMLDFPMHRCQQRYTAELNRLYLNEPALWERDFLPDGFEWIYSDLDELNIIAFKRLDAHGGEAVVLINFAPVDREGFVVEGLSHGLYREVFSSDDARFGGFGRLNTGIIKARPCDDGGYRARLTLPGMTALILKPVTNQK